MPTLIVMVVYAAYGSNLDPSVMARRAPHSPLQDTGWIPDWRLTFAGEDFSLNGPRCTVVEDPGYQVFVALYDLTAADEKSLDTWEGLDLDLCKKLRVRVCTLSEDVPAWTYVVNTYEGGLPTASYLGAIADAAEAGGAPEDYVRQLRKLPCANDDDVDW